MRRPWPADKVERWRTEDLVPAARNSRLHADADIRVISRSIQKFGFTNPVLVDDTGGIIAAQVT
jgi:ParB-like chromosome segregation protein Spo0J